MDNPNGMTGAGSGAGGADELQARLDALLAERQKAVDAQIERTASGFRSVVDRQMGQLRTQTSGELNAIRQQLAEFQGYFQTAQDANLDPEERASRQASREQQNLQRQQQQNAIALNVMAAREKVILAISELGFRWGDPRIDFAMAEYEAAMTGQSDPHAWSATVIMNANAVYRQMLNQQAQLQAEAAQRADAARQAETAQRDRVQNSNSRRIEQAAGAGSRSVPDNNTMDWKEYHDNLPIKGKDRDDYMNNLKRQILRNGVRTPDQLVIPR